MLHAVQVSDAGTDIDHVVIGPAGVFSLNTKRHPDGKVTVHERALYVNGAKVDYLQKSRGEARRASRLLTHAASRSRFAIVFVDLADIKEKGRPDDVLITSRRRLVNLLQGLPVSLSPDEVRTIQQQSNVASSAAAVVDIRLTAGVRDFSVAKYDPLARFLEELPREQLVVTLSFDDVARLVGGLPPSAYRHRQWWANDLKVEARAWRSAGWHVDSDGVDFNGEKVRFARGKVGGTRARRLGLE